MNVLIIRHAIAEDPQIFAATGEEDSLRPLTERGRKRMKRGAAGLRRVAPELTLVASSGLTRALQTADVIAKAYSGLKCVQIAHLAPGKSLTGLMQWLAGQNASATIALVGHEPQLGVFISWALTGLQESFVEMKKGAACMLHFEQDVKAGRAKLLWMLKPSHLRDLGK